MYTNGNLVNDETLDFIIDNNINASLFALGAWIEKNNSYLNMNVKSVMIYNRELSHEEIEKNYSINEMRFGIQEKAALLPDTNI